MAAQVRDRGWPQTPQVRVLAQYVVHASGFAGPFFIFPGTADRGHVLQPRRFLGEILQLLEIAKFPRAAGSIQQKQFVLSGKPALFPIAIESADVADEGSHSGYGTD